MLSRTLGRGSGWRAELCAMTASPWTGGFTHLDAAWRRCWSRRELFIVSQTKTVTRYAAILLGAAEKVNLKRLENRTITPVWRSVRGNSEREGQQTTFLSWTDSIRVRRHCPRHTGRSDSPRVSRRETQGTVVVWNCKESNRGPDWETFYVTMVDAQLLTICNNHEFLREVLSGRVAPRRIRALPASLPEWSFVNRVTFNAGDWSLPE